MNCIAIITGHFYKKKVFDEKSNQMQYGKRQMLKIVLAV